MQYKKGKHSIFHEAIYSFENIRFNSMYSSILPVDQFTFHFFSKFDGSRTESHDFDHK